MIDSSLLSLDFGVVQVLQQIRYRARQRLSSRRPPPPRFPFTPSPLAAPYGACIVRFAAVGGIAPAKMQGRPKSTERPDSRHINCQFLVSCGF
jgi:hypothetical protein